MLVLCSITHRPHASLPVQVVDFQTMRLDWTGPGELCARRQNDNCAFRQNRWSELLLCTIMFVDALFEIMIWFFCVGRTQISIRESSFRNVPSAICECWYFAEWFDLILHYVQLCLSMLCSKLWYDLSAQEGRRFQIRSLHFVMCAPRSANAGISPNALIWFCIMCIYVCRCFVRNYDVIFLRRKDADFDSGIFIL